MPPQPALLASLLALGSAALYGAADFLGGLAARRADTLAVVVVSQCAGMVVLVVMLPLLPDAAPAMQDLIWGAVAGIAVGAGLALLYQERSSALRSRSCRSCS